MCALVTAVTNENREEGMEDWYKYHHILSGFDMSQLPIRNNQFAQENCIHCGYPKLFGYWPHLS